jgi:hypothetical protein
LNLYVTYEMAIGKILVIYSAVILFALFTDDWGIQPSTATPAETATPVEVALNSEQPSTPTDVALVTAALEIVGPAKPMHVETKAKPVKLKKA